MPYHEARAWNLESQRVGVTDASPSLPWLPDHLVLETFVEELAARQDKPGPVLSSHLSTEQVPRLSWAT